MKRFIWRNDGVISIKLRSNFYTLMQMRVNMLCQLFDIKSPDGEWHDIDLDKVKPLFCIYLAPQKFKSLFVEKLDPKKVKPNHRPLPLRMLRIDYLNTNAKVDLIELRTDGPKQSQYSSVGARIIKENLDIKNKKDLEIIYKHELSNMAGDPEKLRKRLINYFDSGINWDEQKKVVFKGIKPPKKL
jgi:hypothetical protein